MRQYVELSSGELEGIIREHLNKKGIVVSPSSSIEVIDGKCTVLVGEEDQPTLDQKLKEVVSVAANLLDIRAPKEMNSAAYFKMCCEIINKLGTSRETFIEEAKQ